jgi:hypothetical protein
LARSYVESTELFGLASVLFALPLVAGYALAVHLAALGRERTARWFVIAGVCATGVVIPLMAGWHGGSDKGRVMVAVALAGLLSAVVAAGLPRTPAAVRAPGRTTERLVVGVLLLVPVLQAAGTNTPLIYVSSECLALWVAVVLIVVSRAARPAISAFAVDANLVLCVVAVALLGGTTTLVSPFKTTGVSSDTVPVSSLGGVRLAPAEAHEYGALEDAVAPYIQRGVTNVLTLDQLSGVAYLVGGVPMGSVWTDAVSPRRTAGILSLACRNGDVDRRQPPVLIVDRDLDAYVIEALRGCGFEYPSDFRQLEVPGGPPGLRVFVPSAGRR